MTKASTCQNLTQICAYLIIAISLNFRVRASQSIPSTKYKNLDGTVLIPSLSAVPLAVRPAPIRLGWQRFLETARNLPHGVLSDIASQSPAKLTGVNAPEVCEGLSFGGEPSVFVVFKKGHNLTVYYIYLLENLKGD